MENGSMMADKFSKLPELAKPSLYEIRLAPCLKTFKVKGQEKIHLEITKPTKFLKLHADRLDVEKVSLGLANGTVLPDLNKEIDTKWKLLTVNFPDEIAPQKAELDFVFSGELCPQLEGFYRSPYKDSNGEQKFMASTQFESVYARKAFPCFDEPTYKAQFDVKLEVQEDLTALSNMNVVSEEKTGQGTKLVTFARTPPMSTYLVAFAIGEFEYIEDKTNIGCVVRVYTMPGKKEHASYALGVGKKAIDYYSEWFGIKMPLPKCDMIGIPEFAMGAMENWGLITYREAYVLFDPALTSSTLKERITLVIGHEVGHFWFGNLVTMKWWNDLWLKEGFASFMEYVFTGYNYPEFNIWSDFVNSEVVRAMQLDSLRNSHPIEVPIENPNELDEIYDSITYSKSNSIIRMLFHHLGESTFQKGLRLYLNKHQYANAITDDLWQALSDASGIDVSALMSTWTKQMGFPLVTVEETQLPGNKRELHLKQARFLADGERDASEPFWQVPIAVTCASDPSKPLAKFLLTKPEDTFVVEGVQPTEWLKLNSQFTSFYRVQYSQEMLKKLLEAVRNREIDVLDRFQICNDLFAIIKAGHLPISQFLEFLSVCQQEDNLFVWESIDGSIAEIDHVLTHLEDEGKLRGRFHQFICNVVEPVAARYGWEEKPGEDMQVKKLRALLNSRLARSQHQPTIQTALAKFADHVKQKTPLEPDLRSTIFSAAARTNAGEVVQDLQNILTSCDFPEIERSCISALGQCSDPALLTQIFQHGIEQKHIKNQDIIYLLIGSAMSGQSSAHQFAWKYFKDNLKQFLDTFGGVHDSLFQHCFKAVTKPFCSTAFAEEFETFCKQNFDENSQKSLDRPIRQILETIKLNERLLQNNVDDLKDFLVKVDI